MIKQIQESYQQQKAERLLDKCTCHSKKANLWEIRASHKNNELSLKSYDYKVVLEYWSGPGDSFPSEEQQTVVLTSTINIIREHWDTEKHERLNGLDWLCHSVHCLETDALYCCMQREACGDTADTVTPYLTLGVKSKGFKVMGFPDFFQAT